MPNVGEGHEGRFLFLFVAQSLICLGLLCWYGIVHQTTGNALGAGITIGEGMASLFVVVAAETMVIPERCEMFAEKYLRRRYNAGFRKAQERWEAWNRRRLEAAAAGKELAELPPTLEESGSTG